MRCVFYREIDRWNDEKLFVAELEPDCGEDFCEWCGDCLHCYGDDPCPHSDSEEHVWTKTVDSLAEALDVLKEREGRIVDETIGDRIGLGDDKKDVKWQMLCFWAKTVGDLREAPDILNERRGRVDDETIGEKIGLSDDKRDVKWQMMWEVRR